MNFREQQPVDAAAALHRFLNSNGVVSGKAHEEAKREFESQERERRVRAALQDAWERVLRAPDSLLRDELADAVKEISGHRPEEEVVDDFLRGILGNADGGSKNTVLQAVRESPVRRMMNESASNPNAWGRAVTSSEQESPRLATRKNRSVPPTGFWLDGVRHETTSWRQVLTRLCEHLVKEDEAVFVEHASKLRGKKKPLFGLSSEELRDALQISGTRLYVEGNISGPQAEKIARRILREVRGFDDGFRVEVKEATADS